MFVHVSEFGFACQPGTVLTFHHFSREPTGSAEAWPALKTLEVNPGHL